MSSGLHDDTRSGPRAGEAAPVVVGAAALLAAALIPAGGVDSGPVLCPFRLLTGIPCPACGLTRSWVHLAHGDVASSLANHPIGPALMLLTLVATVVAGIHLVTRRWLVRPRHLTQALLVLAVATGVFGVWRWIDLLA